MKGIKWVIVLALLAFLGGIVVIWSLAPKEPSYQGRSLSSWVDAWAASSFDRTNAAAVAIRAMGSNGVPILLARLSGPSMTQRKFWQFAGKFIPNEWNPFERNSFRAIIAAEAINLLGTNAQAAFPTLTNLFWSRRAPVTASIALAGLGHDGVSVLLQGLTNQNWSIRNFAASALGEASSDLDKVVPALIEVAMTKCTNQEDYLVRDAAGSSLANLHTNVESVVPVLSEFLTSSNSKTQVSGALCLGMLGADAKAAVPLLLKARSDADSRVRRAAESALNEIDPKAYPPSTNVPSQ